MNEFDPQTLKGVYSAMFTPSDTDGQVNVDMIERIVEFHLDSGLAGFYVAGSTGESFLLSEQERRLVLESVVKFNRGRGKVIAHVGHMSTDVAMDLARHAKQCGADAVSAVGPVYFGSTFDHAYRHYSEIAGATDLSGCIGTSQNFGPKHFVEICELFRKGRIDEARVVQRKINRVIELMVANGERSNQKAIMRYIGFDCGNFRMPFKQLTDREYMELAQKLDNLNVLSQSIQ